MFFRLIVVVFIFFVVILTFKLGPIYFSHYKFCGKFPLFPLIDFTGEMQQALAYVNGRASFDASTSISDAVIRKEIIGVARKRNIVLEEKDIEINRVEDNAEINFEYTAPVDFFIMKRGIHFQVREDTAALWF